jgi:hypothetical protein
MVAGVCTLLMCPSRLVRAAIVLKPSTLLRLHDRLYQSHQWQANLRILDVEEIKTVPYAPLSHPFVERLIGTIRRECLDRLLFWTAADLELKLLDFGSSATARYSNRVRSGVCGTIWNWPPTRLCRTAPLMRARDLSTIGDPRHRGWRGAALGRSSHDDSPTFVLSSTLWHIGAEPPKDGNATRSSAHIHQL